MFYSKGWSGATKVSLKIPQLAHVMLAQMDEH